MTDHIKINDVSPRAEFTTTEPSSDFPFVFPIFEDTDLKVYTDGTLRSLDTDYTVSGAGSSSGGTVTFASPVATGVEVVLLREVPISRTTDFQAGQDIRADVFNDELDRIVAMAQQLDEDLNRTVRRSSTSTGGADVRLPDPAANALIGWNAAGDGLANGPTAAEVSSAETHATAAAASATSASGDAADAEHWAGVAQAAAAGAGGLFSGSEATVPVATDDLVAIKDTSDAGNPKFVTAQGIADLATGTEDQVARDLALLAYIKADIQASDPAGVYGDIISDNFTSDSLAIKTNATHDAEGDFYVNWDGTYGTNLCTEAANASASGAYSGSYDAAKAVDGNTNTRWIDGAPSWWVYDFGEHRVIRQLRTYYGASSSYSWTMTFEYWDGSAWQSTGFSIPTTTGADYGTGWHTHEIPYHPGGTKYRLNFGGSVPSGTETVGGEIQMMEASTPTDMTLQSAPAALPTADPSDVSVYARVRDMEAVVEGTDRVIQVSIDGGATWATASVGNSWAFGEDKVIRADADVSAQTGASLVWRLTTSGGKGQQIRGVYCI